MPEDSRFLRNDAVVLKAVETVLKSEELLEKIGEIIAKKIDQRIDQIVKTFEDKVSSLAGNWKTRIPRSIISSNIPGETH